MLWKPRPGFILSRGAVDGAHVASWQTAFSQALTADSSGWSGFNLRQVVNSSNLALGGSQVRVTLQAANAAGFTIDHAEIGHQAVAGDLYDFDGGQVALTFSGGSAGVTVGAAGSVVSDGVTFTLNNAKNFIIAVHFSATSSIRLAAATGAQGYYKSTANEVSVSDVSSYTTAASNLHLVNKIEVFA